MEKLDSLIERLEDGSNIDLQELLSQLQDIALDVQHLEMEAAEAYAANTDDLDWMDWDELEVE